MIIIYDLYSGRVIKIIHNVKNAVKCIEWEATWIRDKLLINTCGDLLCSLWKWWGNHVPYLLKRVLKGKIDKYQERDFTLRRQVKDIVWVYGNTTLLLNKVVVNDLFWIWLLQRKQKPPMDVSLCTAWQGSPAPPPSPSPTSWRGWICPWMKLTGEDRNKPCVSGFSFDLNHEEIWALVTTIILVKTLYRWLDF